ncbi:serine/threonine protein kinase [Gallibacter sp. Marseille-QA0791]|uniref:serine/threonine protein kinase n=1 Tax=Gallibacter sp. Marseille-QA0791 TaxID=3378781 RepID=UPI003D0E8233
MAKIGAIIDGKYEILKQIGMGGMSTVYLAMDQHLNKQWAVKEIRLRADDRESRVIIQSLIAEANLMKKLDHPALPRIVDIIDSRDTIYVIMDYIEGEPLSRILEREGPQPEEDVLEWARQLCDVLSYLHTRKPPVIYRDMKPGNIMIRPDGNIRLIDFGIAREYKEGKTSDTVALGTKGYAAPEQFGGQGQTDARTDIYSLGVTLYQALTGQTPSEPPYEFYPIRYWDPSLSGGLEKIIAKCVKPNPQDRYQTCTQLYYALNHYEEEDDVHKAAQRRKLRAFTMAAAGFALFLVMGFSGLFLESWANTQNYDSIYQRAEKETEASEKEALLLQCAQLKPDSVQPYEALIDLYKSDLSFQVDEEMEIKTTLYRNLEALQSSEGYAGLAFELGKLYWYYYEYGSGDTNFVTRMKGAVQWFEDALEYGGEDFENAEMAQVYRDIGRFNEDITMEIEEASDAGKYAPYFQSLQQLTAQMETDPDEAEIVMLEVYRLDVDALETYARKFESDGITRQQMEELLASARAGVQQLETTTDKTDALKADVTARLDEAAAAIERAFTRSRVPESERYVTMQYQGN